MARKTPAAAGHVQICIKFQVTADDFDSMFAFKNSVRKLIESGRLQEAYGRRAHEKGVIIHNITTTHD